MNDPLPLDPLPVDIAGVFRCCIATYEAKAPPASETAEGAVLLCDYCSSGLIVRDGMWCWDRESESRPIRGSEPT